MTGTEVVAIAQNQAVFPFVVGFPRSGTTLVRAVLDAHPDCAVPYEGGFIVKLAAARTDYERPEGFDVARFVHDLRGFGPFGYWALSPDDVRDDLADPPVGGVADAIRRLYALYGRRQGKSRFADKTPGNLLELETLSELFAEARFVHVIRDGRDAALSLVQAPFGTPRLLEAAILWRSWLAAGRAVGARLGPGQYLEVRYEELVSDFEAVVRAIADFIQLPFDPCMLRYADRAPELMDGRLGYPEQHQRLREQPSKRRDWRSEMSAANARAFELLAGDMLAELGYPPVGPVSPLASVGARALVLRTVAGRATRGLVARLAK